MKRPTYGERWDLLIILNKHVCKAWWMLYHGLGLEEQAQSFFIDVTHGATSRMTTKTYCLPSYRESIQVLDWSSQSADFNPKEHAFYLLKTKSYKTDL